MTPTREVYDFLCEDYSMKREEICIAEAKANGLEIIDGDGNTLLFDLGGEEAKKVFLERCSFLEEKFGMESFVISKSKSGNFHALVKLHKSFPPIDPIICSLIQACMGSDWKREMLCALRTIHYKASDSKLFRPQPLEVVMKWESSKWANYEES